VIVGLSTTDHAVSRIIRAGTGSKSSHAWLRFPLYDREVVFQSDHRGINLEDWARFQKKNRVVAQYVVDLPFDAIMPELVKQLGAEYDYWGAVGNGLVVLGQVLGRRWENPWQSDDLWYCSEVVAHFLGELGEKLPVKPSAVSPDTLDKILQGSAYSKPVPLLGVVA
jgi:hypothetical protein